MATRVLLFVLVVGGQISSSSHIDDLSDSRLREHAEYVKYNAANPSVLAQTMHPVHKKILIGADGLRDDFGCYLLNTAAERMAHYGFGGMHPKPHHSLGFHSTDTLETQVVFPPSAAFYRPLARVPRNDGCAYQSQFGAQPDSGCVITGVDAEPINAGGFRYPPPSANASHCQRFSSCVPLANWTADPRHASDEGAQAQWCSELSGCWQPATGVRTNNGCKCYSDRPLKDEYGPDVAAETVLPALDGATMQACASNWMRLLGGTRCGYFGFDTMGQAPTGPVIRDRGEGLRDNPTLLNLETSRAATETLEQDSDSFVFRRHPACLDLGGAGAAAGDIGSIQDCAFEGQLQLGAMTISDSGAPQIVPFETPLNHSFVYTLRISFQERGAEFELLAADGARRLERHWMPHQFCYNAKLGRNLGLTRLPLPGESNLTAACNYISPIDVCFGSDPTLWGTTLWTRNAGAGVGGTSGDPDGFRTVQQLSGAKCEPPFCF